MENYNKIALDTPDLLTLLKQRGLQIPDEQEALQILSSVSYYRIACYFRPMEIDKQTHKFRGGKLIQKKTVFAEVTQTKSAVHTVMVTTNGLIHNAYTGEIQNEVVLDDLFL